MTSNPAYIIACLLLKYIRGLLKLLLTTDQVQIEDEIFIPNSRFFHSSLAQHLKSIGNVIEMNWISIQHILIYPPPECIAAEGEYKKCWKLIHGMEVQLKHQTACWVSSSSSWSRGSESGRFQQKVKLRIKKWTQQMLVKNVLHIDRMKRVGRRPRKNLVKLKQPREISFSGNAGDDVIYVII